MYQAPWLLVKGLVLILLFFIFSTNLYKMVAVLSILMLSYNGRMKAVGHGAPPRMKEIFVGVTVW